MKRFIFMAVTLAIAIVVPLNTLCVLAADGIVHQSDAFGNEIMSGESTHSDVKIILNGTELTFDQPPVIENGRTLVPARAVMEAMGAIMQWDEPGKTATAMFLGRSVSFRVGEEGVHVEQPSKVEYFDIDVAPKILNDRILIPIRALAESLDSAKIDWDEQTRTIYISYPKQETPYDEFLSNSANYHLSPEEVAKYSNAIDHSEHCQEECWSEDVSVDYYLLRDVDNDGNEELVISLDGGRQHRFFGIWSNSNGIVELKHGFVGGYSRGRVYYGFANDANGDTLLCAAFGISS